jgi:hypothetical protein
MKQRTNKEQTVSVQRIKSASVCGTSVWYTCVVQVRVPYKDLAVQRPYLAPSGPPLMGASKNATPFNLLAMAWQRIDNSGETVE